MRCIHWNDWAISLTLFCIFYYLPVIIFPTHFHYPNPNSHSLHWPQYAGRSLYSKSVVYNNNKHFVRITKSEIMWMSCWSFVLSHWRLPRKACEQREKERETERERVAKITISITNTNVLISNLHAFKIGALERGRGGRREVCLLADWKPDSTHE